MRTNSLPLTFMQYDNIYVYVYNNNNNNIYIYIYIYIYYSSESEISPIKPKCNQDPAVTMIMYK